jgi:transposase-like protein
MRVRTGKQAIERERIIIASVQSRKPMKIIAHECGISLSALYGWIHERTELRLKIGNIRKKHRRPVPDELRWQRAKNQIASLERVIANHPPFRPRTLKAPSDLPFARAALESYVNGLDKSKEAVQK